MDQESNKERWIGAGRFLLLLIVLGASLVGGLLGGYLATKVRQAPEEGCQYPADLAQSAPASRLERRRARWAAVNGVVALIAAAAAVLTVIEGARPPVVIQAATGSNGSQPTHVAVDRRTQVFVPGIGYVNCVFRPGIGYVAGGGLILPLDEPKLHWRITNNTVTAWL